MRFPVFIFTIKYYGNTIRATIVKPQSTIIHIEGNKSLVRVGVPKICPRDERHILWMKCYVRKVNTILNNIISWKCYLRRIIIHFIVLFLWQSATVKPQSRSSAEQFEDVRGPIEQTVQRRKSGADWGQGGRDRVQVRRWKNSSRSGKSGKMMSEWMYSSFQRRLVTWPQTRQRTRPQTWPRIQLANAPTIFVAAHPRWCDENVLRRPSADDAWRSTSRCPCRSSQIPLHPWTNRRLLEAKYLNTLKPQMIKNKVQD